MLKNFLVLLVVSGIMVKGYAYLWPGIVKMYHHSQPEVFWIKLRQVFVWAMIMDLSVAIVVMFMLNIVRETSWTKKQTATVIIGSFIAPFVQVGAIGFAASDTSAQVLLIVFVLGLFIIDFLKNGGARGGSNSP
ncbi:hypothetical protein [Thermincola ferriacetica]|uniref:hypothetical protein n=1 Tax=Thermincola ferriacetica TaxID=281456 RepID=UPI001A9A3A67|nr:hypothetical protein [Thermincola ferriacetica]